MEWKSLDLETEWRRRTERLVCALMITLCFVILSSPTEAQVQPGSMVNIDCGISTPYRDNNNLTWVPDSPFVTTGINVQNLTQPRDLAHLRYFPEPRKKTCYVLPTVSGGRYFIRGRFCHGGYDGKTQPDLSFNVSIEATKIMTITILNISDVYAFTDIVQATKNTIYVCLIRNSPTGHPFMSSLQSVTLAPGMYPETEDPAGLRYLSFVNRKNYGGPGTGTYSYPQDPYDRTWRNDGVGNSPSALTTDQVVSIGAAYNRPPSLIMQTAKFGAGANDTFTKAVPISTHYVLYLYFAEIDNTTTVGSRVFDILINDVPWVKNFDILANRSGVLYESMQLTKAIESAVPSFSFTLVPSANTAQPPLINGAEVLHPSDIVALRALEQDVLGVESIKAAFKLDSWTGDPCLPVPYDWITCDSSSPARVIAVQLANMSLTGSIPSGIANLTALVTLNLENNNLTGAIPDSVLAIPGLTIQAGGNPVLQCPGDDCTFSTNGKKPGASETGSGSNIAVIIGAGVGGAVVVGIIIFFLILFMRRRKKNGKKNGRGHDSDTISQKLQSKQPPSLVDSPREDYPSLAFQAVKRDFTPMSDSNVPVLTPLEIVTGSLFVPSNDNSKTSEASNSSSRSRHSGSSVEKRSTTSSERVEVSLQQDVRKYTWEEILVMTNNNRVELGKGGFGPVYFGELADGRKVAVKILSATSHQGTREFLNEVDLLSRVNHGNLVKLVGYCQEPEQVLVYEFAEEGTLREHLHGGKRAQTTNFNWKIRLNIAVNSACGLEYLHNGCRPSIIHRDIKSSNILLTKSMYAKVADFGLSKLGADEGDITKTHVSTMVKGTVGYIDPDYFTSNQLTFKSDVFSFGVVLLEIVTGRKPIQPCDDPSHRYIGNWVRDILQCKFTSRFWLC
ncbi:hypothetical protein KC19_4G046800 [Ceratodon purpureus]|uniref:Protein kinase domain-containing protein n=1 Tax=Ceratodon purpureus TaxID=3225 RepID=A0A8T0I5L7_CERPU|nr:hypothetical protein KC19_4G046800 [Ceratodon purpureus]